MPQTFWTEEQYEAAKTRLRMGGVDGDTLRGHMRRKQGSGSMGGNAHVGRERASKEDERGCQASVMASRESGQVSTACPKLSRAGSNPAPSLFSPLTIALTGQLVSGKNQVQLRWHNGKVHKYPNKTFIIWRAVSLVKILDQGRPVKPIAVPVTLTCNYWPGDLRTRDVSGMLDALFHLLVYAKVLKDDGLIWNVWWRRHELNRKFPKVVMEIAAW